ncbi:hypothetical protein [Streptomyces europaeiscabiei]|uniref:hypothetical protein n=1 Tax=Streptomyces europaeiscabiei TaxID=146819 RepID=UPI000E68A23C|nr:hypothetical protein [Streptomyces europaeiscabiei]
MIVLLLVALLVLALVVWRAMDKAAEADVTCITRCALAAIVSSSIFRSSGQDLTTTGTYIEMGTRLLEPALLALAVLAIRGPHGCRTMGRRIPRGPRRHAPWPPPTGSTPPSSPRRTPPAAP